MLGTDPQRNARRRPARNRSARPRVEALEGRELLATVTGAQWSLPIRVTYSIVPDGTSIGGVASNLQATLAGKPGWEQQIRKAAAIWSAASGINLVQVADSGDPIGTSGYQQGDPRFGDIRIGGMAQSTSQLGFAYSPPPFNGGTNAGDIFFNTAQIWQVDGTTYDLLTVALHEFGHALGLGHTGSSPSSMQATYGGARSSLATDDTQGIQAIYGPRSIDAFDASAANNSYLNATNLTPYVDGNGQIAIAGLEVTTRNDADWYKVTVPSANAGAMSVKMQSNNLGSLSPQLEVYNASLGFLGRSSSPNSFGATVGGTVNGVGAGQTYYIKVMPAGAGAADAGTYGLMVNFGSGTQGGFAPPSTVVAAQPDLNPGGSALKRGWMVDGVFTPFFGVLDAVGGLLDVGFGVLPIPGLSGLLGLGNLDEGLLRITYGTLTGIGQVEEATNRHAGHGHSLDWGRVGDEGMLSGGAATPDIDHFLATVAPEAGESRKGGGDHSVRPTGRSAIAAVESLPFVDFAASTWRADGLPGENRPIDGESFLPPSWDGTRPRARRRPPQAWDTGPLRGLP